MNYPIKYIKPEEFKKLLQFVYNENVRHGLILELIGNGGLRINECLMLTPQDFDFEKNSIMITTLKQKQHPRPRIPIQYPSRTMYIMRKYIEGMKLKEDECIFTMTRQGVWKFFKNYCRILKLPS